MPWAWSEVAEWAEVAVVDGGARRSRFAPRGWTPWRARTGLVQPGLSKSLHSLPAPRGGEQGPGDGLSTARASGTSRVNASPPHKAPLAFLCACRPNSFALAASKPTTLIILQSQGLVTELLPADPPSTTRYLNVRCCSLRAYPATGYGECAQRKAVGMHARRQAAVTESADRRGITGH